MVFRRSKSLTVSELAVLASKGAVDSTIEGPRSLHGRLYTYGSDAQRARWQYWVELLVLGLFPWDLAIAKRFGARGEPARMQARELLRGFVNQTMTWPDFKEFSPRGWQDFLVDHFAEYAEALKPSREGGQALLRMGGTIHERMLGGAKDMDAIMTIVAWLTADLKSTDDLLSGIRVK